MSYRFKKIFREIKPLALILTSIITSLILIETTVPITLFCWNKTYRAFFSDDDKFYIYCVGGSTMAGWPYNKKISQGKIIAHLFDNKINNKEIKVITLAEPGSNLHYQFLKLKKELTLRPQKNAIIILYSGLNESLMFMEKEEELFTKWKIAQKSIILSTILKAINASHTSIFANTSNVNISYLKAGTLKKYRYFLNKTIALANENKMPLIISTLTCNLTDYNPLPLYKNDTAFTAYASDKLQPIMKTTSDNLEPYLPNIEKTLQQLDDFIAAKKINFEIFLNENNYKRYVEATLLEKQNKPAEAMKIYKSLNNVSPLNELFKNPRIAKFLTGINFRMGKTAEVAQDFSEALKYYKLSLPLYWAGERPYRQLNDVITETAKDANIPLTNTNQIISEHSENNLPGYELFIDATHPNLTGSILVAYGFAKEIEKITSQKITNRNLSKKQLINIFNLSNNDIILSYIISTFWMINAPDFTNDENMYTVKNYLIKIKSLLNKHNHSK